MDQERLKFQGRLAEAETDARRDRIAIDGLVRSLRGLLDPFEATEERKDEQILDQAIRLSNLTIGYRQRLSEIAALKKALGR